MKRVLLLIGLCFTLAYSFSQTKSGLPIDPAIKIAKLPNGFTYYLSNGEKPEKVTIYLVVKAGSNQENKEQIQVAHLIEHMPFNNSRHFPDVFDHFMKMGVTRGTQLNAFTSYDRTVYSLIEIPSNKPQLLQDGLRFLRECAQGLVIDSANVHHAASEIAEEGRSSAASGIDDKYLEEVISYPGFHYLSSRQIVEGVKKVTPDLVRRFYVDFYRPDLQGLIVVGKFDKDQIEKTIVSLFSDLNNIPIVQNQKKLQEFKWENRIIKVAREDVKSIKLETWIKLPYEYPKTIKDFSNYLATNLVFRMLKNRVNEDSDEEDENANYSEYVKRNILSPRLFSTLKIVTRTTLKDVKNSFINTMLTLKRVRDHGFTLNEFIDAKKAFLENYRDKSLKSLIIQYSSFYSKANKLLEHFVTGEPIPSYETVDQALNKIVLNDINKISKELLVNKENRDLIVFSPSRNLDLLPSKQDFSQWLDEVENTITYNPKSESKDTLSINHSLIPGAELKKMREVKAFRSVSTDEFGITKIVLLNGLTIYLKPTEGVYNEELFVDAKSSTGGVNFYSKEDYFSARWSGAIIRNSGLAAFNKSELEKFKTGKGISLKPSILAQNSRIEARSDIRNAETLFQLIYLYFVTPPKDIQGFNETIKSLKRSGLEKNENLGKINFERAFEIYKEQFSSPGNFTFVVTGAFNERTMLPIITRYLGNIPSKKVTNGFHSPDSTQGVASNVSPTVKGFEMIVDSSKTEYIGTVKINFLGNISYNPEKSRIMSILQEVLQNLMIKRLRRKDAGTYGAIVGLNYNKANGQYKVSISFNCDPSRMKYLTNSALEEVNKLKSAGIDQSIFDVIVSYNQLSFEESMKTGEFWIKYIGDSIQSKGDFLHINRVKKLLEQLTPEDIKLIARELLREK